MFCSISYMVAVYLQKYFSSTASKVCMQFLFLKHPIILVDSLNHQNYSRKYSGIIYSSLFLLLHIDSCAYLWCIDFYMASLIWNISAFLYWNRVATGSLETERYDSSNRVAWFYFGKKETNPPTNHYFDNTYISRAEFKSSQLASNSWHAW